MENAVAIAALGILGGVVTALIWLLKRLFNQNDTTLKLNTEINANLAKSIDNLNDTMLSNDKNRIEFQTGVIATLKKLSEVQDSIACKQTDMYNKIETKTMNVSEMNVAHETIKAKV